MVSSARRVLAQAALALLALSTFLPPLSAGGSHAGAPALLAPLLFNHLRPLTPAYGTPRPSRPGREMAADYANRHLAPPARSRRVPRLPLSGCALLSSVGTPVSLFGDTWPIRAPPNVQIALP